jgi:hypothetical protein
MLASFPPPGLTPTIRSTMLFPLVIPVVAMRNLRPIDKDAISTANTRFASATDLCFAWQPIGWLRSLYTCSPQGKKLLWSWLVHAKKLRRLDEFTEKEYFPETHFGQSNRGSLSPSGPIPLVQNPWFPQGYLPIHPRILSILLWGAPAPSFSPRSHPRYHQLAPHQVYLLFRAPGCSTHHPSVPHIARA